jgi:hypothetical protein
MKLILENWNKFLNEQSKVKTIVGYHGTSSGLNLKQLMGFKKISPKNRGFDAEAQGEGFYLFRDKKRAINHASSHGGRDGDYAEKFKSDEHGYRVIITLEVPYDAKVLDIDYEVGVASLYKWVAKHHEYLKKLEYNGKSAIDDIIFNQGKSGDQIHIKWGDGIPAFQKFGPSRITKTLGAETGQPQRIAKFFKVIEQGHPMLGKTAKMAKSLAADFQGEMIEKADAFKYNGPEIDPTKVEIIVNEVLVDVTDEVKSGDSEGVKNKIMDYTF